MEPSARSAWSKSLQLMCTCTSRHETCHCRKQHGRQILVGDIRIRCGATQTATYPIRTVAFWGPTLSPSTKISAGTPSIGPCSQTIPNPYPKLRIVQNSWTCMIALKPMFHKVDAESCPKPHSRAHTTCVQTELKPCLTCDAN